MEINNYISIKLNKIGADKYWKVDILAVAIVLNFQG